MGGLPVWVNRQWLFVEVASMLQRTLWLGAIVAVVMSVAALVARYSQENLIMAADEKKVGEGQLAHMVFFTLADPNESNRKRLVEACKKYLDKHEGVVYFSVGTLNSELKRPENDQQYDVALHLVFKDKAAHDRYQVHARHKAFIDDNKALWSKVRVFDSDVR
jgi:Stress responsive A/B Barrel Domain